MNTKNQPVSTPTTTPIPKIIADVAFNALTKNAPLFLCLGLTKKHMDTIYAQGYYFYSQRKYQEALPLFKALTFYHYLDQRGWMGAAGCHEMLKQYQEALSCYSFAAILDHHDPIPALHAFDCYIALNNQEKALACLEAVILISSKKPEYEVLKKRAEALRDAFCKKAAH